MFKYVCQNFKDGQVLTADCLNKMEEGIENACQTPGPQGEKGDDGVSVTHEWDGTTLKITSASGTSSADLRGPTGPIGIKGNPGDAGKSAYEYARDGGYMGSETKFSEQLAGIPDWDKVKTYTANTNIVIAQQSLSSGMWMNRKQDIEPGIPYAVYIGGKEYFCIAGNEDGTIYLGNPKLFDSASTQAHNNEPFCITWAGGAATAGMFFKDATLSYPITLKVTGAAVTTENKLPEKYLPDGVAMKSDIPEGGGGANIDVVASVGQTIVVEEVDADGKPTKWKSADFPEGVKVYTILEIEKQDFYDVISELDNHPIWLYCRKDDGAKIFEAYVPLSYRNGSVEGVGFVGYLNMGFMVYLENSTTGKAKVDLREITIPFFQGDALSSGVLKYNGSSWYMAAEQNNSPGILNIAVEQLVDGAMISVSYEQYVSALTNSQRTGLLLIATTVSNATAYIPALFMSIPLDLYPATVKIISPSTDGIITITIIPEI